MKELQTASPKHKPPNKKHNISQTCFKGLKPEAPQAQNLLLHKNIKPLLTCRSLKHQNLPELSSLSSKPHKSLNQAHCKLKPASKASKQDPVTKKPETSINKQQAKPQSFKPVTYFSTQDASSLNLSRLKSEAQTNCQTLNLIQKPQNPTKA